MRIWNLTPLLLVSACSVLQSAPTAQPDKALVYAYRQALPLGPSGDIQLSDGKDRIASLPAGSYAYFYTTPGPRALKAESSNMGSLPYATSFSAGQTYYLLIYVLGNQATGEVRIAPVDASTAHFEMKDLKRAP